MARRLRRRVGEHPRQRFQAGRRADVDDAAGTVFDHVPAENLARQHETLQIHGEDFVHFLL